MSTNSLYQKNYFNRLGEFANLSPESFHAFVKFDTLALKEGKLSAKLKELIAIAVAHTTGCPYCIELHITQAKQKNASKEEASEAIMIATALKAGSALAHGVNALNAYDGNTDEELYKEQYFLRIKEFSTLHSSAFNAFIDFDTKTMKDGLLTGYEKELIAIAVAHTTGCPYCISLHVQAAKKLGVSKEEIAESIVVATALKAGSALAHGVNALNAYDQVALLT
ncbi:carboxymuconolactone decarboxylase family protein [Lysinibacillus sp. C5.1]|uniref:carboxymuconolactone decarboxylase family protein n=1 Tax=Lysinibacillus sp. C5.1 TaxID=2796169 RepID=UPI0030819F1D